MRQHDQGKGCKQEQGDTASASRHGSKCRKLKAGILNQSHKAERSGLGVACIFKLSKPAISDIFPPAKLPLFTLPKHCHQLETKHSNAWDIKFIEQQILGGGGLWCGQRFLDMRSKARLVGKTLIS